MSTQVSIPTAFTAAALACAVTAGALPVSRCAGGDWPAFRGPLGNGVATDETSVPVRWDAAKNVLWKNPLPGPGNSSPIVSGGRVFVVCAEESGRKRRLMCFDAIHGAPRWVETVAVAEVEPTHATNPYAASTPAADGKRVVVWHGTPGLFCYDFDGKQLWSIKLGEARHEWGYGSSPILFRNRVILNHGPGRDSFLVAVDLTTGKVRWKTPEPGGVDQAKSRLVGSWSTPVTVLVDGKEQIVCTMPTRVVAYDADTGKILWTCRGIASPRGELAYASPAIAGDLAVALGGYNGPALGLRLGGEGDVTDSRRLWRHESAQPQRIGSGVVVGDHLFLVNAGPGTAECIAIKTGKQLWQHRLGDNQWGSLVLAAGRLYATDQRGVTTVLAPNPSRFEEIARNPIGEPTNSTLAVAGGRIYLRTDAHLFCIAE